MFCEISHPHLRSNFLIKRNQLVETSFHFFHCTAAEEMKRCVGSLGLRARLRSRSLVRPRSENPSRSLVMTHYPRTAPRAQVFFVGTPVSTGFLSSKGLFRRSVPCATSSSTSISISKSSSSQAKQTDLKLRINGDFGFPQIEHSLVLDIRPPLKKLSDFGLSVCADFLYRCRTFFIVRDF